MTRTIVEVSPGPSLPTTFAAQIGQPTQPSPSVMPPVALVEIQTAAELIPGPPGSPDTGADILVKLAPVDGSGSGLDADLLDGQDSPYYLARANHTGQQAISTVTGLQTALDSKVDDAEYTAADVMAKVQSVDGAGSGLDADLLDGQHGTFYSSLANQTGTISDAQHGNRAGGSLHALVGAAAGFMSAADKTKLDTVAAGAIADAPSDGTQYVRKNAAWDPVDVPPGTYIGDTPPAGPDPGQLWWESDSGKLYIWFDDGSSAQWVQVAGGPTIADAPSDGGEYVRVNGVWRKKSQSFDPTGSAYNIAVPAGAKHATIRGRLFGTAAGLNPVIRASIDGSTFLSGASDYIYSGSILYTGTSGSPSKIGALSASYYYLGMGAYTDRVDTALWLDVDLVVGKPSGVNFGFRSRLAAYHTAGTAGFQEALAQGYSNWANHLTQTQMAAFQLTLTGGTAFAAGSNIKVEWSY